MADKQKFPSEVIALPSKGLVYPEDSSLHSGNLEIKYMTAKEEDILTSQNLIKKGIVIDKLLDSLILTDGVKSENLIIGDKNSVMIASRILAYGPEYTTEITDPNTGNKSNHTFNLADCPFKELPEDVDYSNNEFEVELPVSKINIKFKLLTGKDEKKIDKDIRGSQKLGTSTEITTRLAHIITEIDGESNKTKIRNFVNVMLSRDSLFLRQEVLRLSPDIDLTQEIEIGGELVTVDIPLTTEFFWPTTF